MSEVIFITRSIPGVTADYIEKKPVSFRKKLVKDLLDEMNKNSDGSDVIKRK